MAIRSKRFLVALAVLGIAAAVVPPWLSVRAQAPPAISGRAGIGSVGAWLGNVDLQPGLGFPFAATFNADGTWTAADTRGFGLIPLPFPFTAKASMITGAWTKVGGHSYVWTGTQILVDSTLPGCTPEAPCYFLLVVRGAHDVTPDDPNHMTNGRAGARIWACGNSAFTCPKADDILSERTGFTPTFTFTLTRVPAQ